MLQKEDAERESAREQGPAEQPLCVRAHLALIEGGVSSLEELAHRLGVTKKRLSQELTKLRQAGLAHPPRWGHWAAGPEAAR